MTTPAKVSARKPLAPYRLLLAGFCLVALGWFVRDAWDWANTVDAPAREGIPYDRDTVLRLGSEGLYMRVNRPDTYSMVQASWLETAAMQSLIYERMGKSDVRKIYYYIRLDMCLNSVEGAKRDLMRGPFGGTAWAIAGRSPGPFLLGFVNRMRFPDTLADEPSQKFPVDFGARQRAALDRLCIAATKQAEGLEPIERKITLEYIDEMRNNFGYLLNTVSVLPLEQAQEVLDYAFPLDGKGELVMPSVGQ